jgi:glycerol kinase
MLPGVKHSSDHYGMYEILETDIPINGVGGDQQAALFGQRCWNSGQAKNTYGTGCFLLMNTGEDLKISNFGLISTIACGINNKIQYALEGSVFVAGAAIQWLRDGLRIIENSAESESKAESVESSEGIYVVPAFAGLGAPYWDMSAKGAIFGLTRGSNQGHIVRATLESIAYQTTDIVRAMELDAGIKMKTLKVDGGATQNDFLMQFQSNILNVVLERAKVSEVTALGAAYLAGIYSGFYDLECLKDQENDEFVPSMTEDERTAKYAKWKEAVKRTMNWDK